MIIAGLDPAIHDDWRYPTPISQSWLCRQVDAPGMTAACVNGAGASNALPQEESDP